jgi:hypothetical protein
MLFIIGSHDATRLTNRNALKGDAGISMRGSPIRADEDDLEHLKASSP